MFGIQAAVQQTQGVSEADGLNESSYQQQPHRVRLSQAHAFEALKELTSVHSSENPQGKT